MSKPKRVSLFKVIRREMAPLLETLGLREVPWDNSHLEYKRTENPDDIVGLWFQRDEKALDVDVFGSSFTVEFARSFEMKDRERMFYLLSAEQLETMRKIQNRMIGRLPPTPSELWVSAYTEEWQREICNEPYNPLHGRWMRYRDEEDLLAWTGYLREVLPGALAKFEAAFPPAPVRRKKKRAG